MTEAEKTSKPHKSTSPKPKATATKQPKPRITKREKLILASWRDQATATDAEFFRDKRLVRAALQYLPVKELLEIELPAPSTWGTRFFDAEFLPVAARAIRHREAWINFEFKNLERLLLGILEGHNVTPTDVRIIVSRLRECLDLYVGPPDTDTYIHWAMAEVGATIKALRIRRAVERENYIVFAELYNRTQRAAWAGVCEELKDCRDLGFDRVQAEEIVHATFVKILLKMEDWRDGDDNEASLETRVRRFAESQALGWRTERIRDKQRKGRLLGGVRRRRKELLYPVGAKKPSADLQNVL